MHPCTQHAAVDCWCWYTFDAWAPSSLEVGIILVRDLVQVWAITAPSQPLTVPNDPAGIH